MSASEWWYYSVEFEDGMRRGIYPDSLPMLPRMLLDRCDVRGLDLLDVGCMEGLIPALATRRGAKAMAVDVSNHCEAKLERVRAAYGDFPFKVSPVAYELHRQIPKRFDFVNLSGLLYHVVSPLLVLLGARPLLKMGGLMIVATNVIAERGYSAHFNAHGRIQIEANTFWYPTIDLLDYWLRMVGLDPIDALYLPHSAVADVPLGESRVSYVFDKPSGYLALMCRAMPMPAGDEWMRLATRDSVDFCRLGGDWSQERSIASYTRGRDAWAAVATPTLEGPGHVLRLADV